MNLVDFGVPLVAILVVCIVWLVPIAAGVWALVTLHRMRTTQLEMQSRLNAIEQLLKPR